MFNKVLVTGSSGFIGSNLADAIYKEKIAKNYVFLDGGFIGSNKLWMQQYYNCINVSVLKMDLSKPETYNQLIMQGHNDIDCILHLASNTHVDRSISNGIPFVLSNLVGTARLLEFSKNLNLKVFLNFATDEIMGQRTIQQGAYRPYDRKMVRNVYSATKSGQEELGFGYAITHDIPVMTTRCTNIYGRRQYPEKFLPVIITKLLQGEKIPLYGEGLQEREWVHVDDVCRTVINLLTYFWGKDSSEEFVTQDAHYNIFHIAGNKTYRNIDFLKLVISKFFMITQNIAEIKDFDIYFNKIEDRKAHDFRYDLDAEWVKTKIHTPLISIEQGLEDTINWYIDFYKEYPEGWN